MNADITAGTLDRQSGSWTARAVVAMTIALFLLVVTLHTGNAQQHGSEAQLRFQGNCVRSGGDLTTGAEGNAGWTRCIWNYNGGGATILECDFTGPYLWTCTAETRPPSHLVTNPSGNGKLSAEQLTAIRLQAAIEGKSLVIDDRR